MSLLCQTRATPTCWISDGARMLAGFLGVVGVAHCVPPEEVQRLHADWGFPLWVPMAIGSLHLLAAVLLCRDRTTPAGVVLAAALTGSTMLLSLLHAELGYALAAAAVLLVPLVLARAIDRARTGLG